MLGLYWKLDLTTGFALPVKHSGSDVCHFQVDFFSCYISPQSSFGLSDHGKVCGDGNSFTLIPQLTP